MILDLEKFDLAEVAGLCLLASEYLAFQQRKPVFQMAELRILTGFGGMDWISQQYFDDFVWSGLDGQLDRLHWILTRFRGGPSLDFSRVSVPDWSHFKKGRK